MSYRAALGINYTKYATFLYLHPKKPVSYYVCLKYPLQVLLWVQLSNTGFQWIERVSTWTHFYVFLRTFANYLSYVQDRVYIYYLLNTAKQLKTQI